VNGLLHSALPVKWLAIPGEKLNIVVVRVVPLVVLILRSAVYIMNFVRSSV